MSSKFVLSVSLRGHNGKVVRKIFELGTFDLSGDEGAEYEAAISAADQLMGALFDVTDAAISGFSLACVNATESLNSHVVTTYGTGDVFQAALLNLALYNNAGLPEAGLVGQSYIPAPKIGIFEGTDGADRDRIDRDDTDLVQYVQQIEQHTTISDNQTVDPDQGNNGLLGGRRVTRKLRATS